MAALGQSAAMRHQATETSLSAQLVLPSAELCSLASRRAEIDAVAARHRLLARAIKDAVVPRIALAHAAKHPVAVAPAPQAADVAALFGLLLQDDRAAAAALVAALEARGVPAERILLDLLAPVARDLGRAWEEDRCDFPTVTMGLLRLQQIMRDCLAGPSQDALPGPRRILLANPPGEQHTFGRDMLAGFFRQAGWTVWDPPPRSASEFGRLVTRERFDVVGISAGATARLDAVVACIRSVRRSAANAATGIMVGGPLFHAHPEYVALVGADATAADAEQAILAAERLLSLLACRD